MKIKLMAILLLAAVPALGQGRPSGTGGGRPAGQAVPRRMPAVPVMLAGPPMWEDVRRTQVNRPILGARSNLSSR